MSHVLSIQSHVATGYVGNRSAVFPLQRLGCEVSFINTVQFSNHTGHGHWRGDIFSAEHIQDVINGLWELNGLQDIDAVLSGYQGTPAIGQVIIDTVEKLKSKRPEVLYCCDPVLGDFNRDVYVLPETAAFIKQHVIDVADILTPNQFELAYLTDKKIDSLEDVLTACQQLHQRGPKIILITSLQYEALGENNIGMLLSTPQGIWRSATPRLPFTEDPTGSGDLTTAIFLAAYLKNQDNPEQVLQFTISAVYSVFKHTAEQDTRDLQIIKAQNDFVNPTELFPVEEINR